MSKYLILLVGLVLPGYSIAQKSAGPLESELARISSQYDATVGVSVYQLEKKQLTSFQGNIRLPMQSVFKFHIALAVLDQVDKGTLDLHTPIPISKGELLPRTWSPIRDNYPNGTNVLTLDSLIRFTVAWSDNNGCDILLRKIGGPGAVEKFIRSKGIKDITIRLNEEQMQSAWDLQFQNQTSARATARLLQLFYDRKIVSSQSTSYLIDVMVATQTGKKRLKGLLPSSAVVAHKTGTSSKQRNITAATNDVGIITLP